MMSQRTPVHSLKVITGVLFCCTIVFIVWYLDQGATSRGLPMMAFFRSELIRAQDNATAEYQEMTTTNPSLPSRRNLTTAYAVNDKRAKLDPTRIEKTTDSSHQLTNPSTHQEMERGKPVDDTRTATVNILTKSNAKDEKGATGIENLKTANAEDDRRAAAMDKLMEKTRPSLDKLKTSFVYADDDADQENKLTAEEYKKLRAEQFIKDYADPSKKGVPPTIKPNGPPTPRQHLVKDARTKVETMKIDEDLRKEKKKRMDAGDDDILQIPEVRAEIEKNPNSVPNIVHFVWYSCHRYKVHHLTSMMSALVIQKPRVILFHTNCAPQGEYWDAFLKEAGAKLRIVKRTPPTEVWGTKMSVVEHKSDVSRLRILLEAGGIYLDCDSIILKSFDPLRKHEMVMGLETSDALGNSIMLANRNSWFLKRWYQEYRYFDDSKWAESSVLLPCAIWQLSPSKIHVVEDEFLRPNYVETDYIYQQLFDWSKNYAMHLWARFMKRSDGTSERSLMELAILNTTYGEISRNILWGDKRPRDISFLM